MTRKSGNELWLATVDFDLPKKKIVTSFSNKWSCDITTSENISAQRHFIEHLL